MIAIIDYDAGNLKSVEKAFVSLGEEAVITRDRDEILRADRVVLPGVGAFGDAMEKLRQYGLMDVIREVADSGKPFLGICLGLQLLFESSEESPGVEGLGICKGQILKIPGASHRGAISNGCADLAGAALAARADSTGASHREAISNGCADLAGAALAARADSTGASHRGAISNGCADLAGAAGHGAIKIPHMGWNSITYDHPGRLFAGIPEDSYVYFVHSYYLKAADPEIVTASTCYSVKIHASIEQGNVFACQFHPEKSSQVGLAILKNFIRAGRISHSQGNSQPEDVRETAAMRGTIQKDRREDC